MKPDYIHYNIKATNWVGATFFSNSYISEQELYMSRIDPTEIIVRKHMSEAFWGGIEEWDKYKDRTVTVSAKKDGEDDVAYCMWYYYYNHQWQYMIVHPSCASLYSPRIPQVVFEKRRRYEDRQRMGDAEQFNIYDPAD
jgi:hypothetical protein